LTQQQQTQQVQQAPGILIGGMTPVGEYLEQWGDDLGRVIPMTRSNPSPAQIKPVVASLNNRALQFQQTASRVPALQALSKFATQTTTTVTAALQAAAAARFKATHEWLNRPTHVIPVNFDAVAAATLSGVATVAAPHNSAWRLIAIQVNDAQALGMRITSFTLANTEHVVTSNVTFSGGAPTSPGIDASIFSNRMNTVLLPEYRYRPWALKRGGVLRSDAVIKIQVYNPGAAAASLNLTLFVQSSPCGDGDGYATEKGGVHPMGSEQSEAFLNSLASGGMSFWPRYKGKA